MESSPRRTSPVPTLVRPIGLLRDTASAVRAVRRVLDEDPRAERLAAVGVLLDVALTELEAIHQE